MERTTRDKRIEDSTMDPSHEVLEATIDGIRPLGINRRLRLDKEAGLDPSAPRWYAVAHDTLVMAAYAGIAYEVISHTIQMYQR